MGAKSAAILEKVSQDRRRGDYNRALQRLSDGISKIPDDMLLYEEAIDVALEAGESMNAVHFCKQAHARLPSYFEDLWEFAAAKVAAYNDPVLCKFLLELAVKKRQFKNGEAVLENLKDHTADELLKRTRTKMQSLSTAMSSGFAFKGEMIVGALSEAMLCLRSKRFAEAAKSFMRILDEKPVEHEGLTPFFAHLEKKYSKKGPIIYALGCCYLHTEQYMKAMPKLLQGVTLTPSFADDAITRLELLRDKRGLSAVDIDFGIARIYIANGDTKRGAKRLSAILAKNQARAPRIMDLLAAHVEEVTEEGYLDYIYIEAAILAEKSEKALAHIKAIYRDRRRRTDLVPWLDTKRQERSLPLDIMTYFGEIALEQNMFEKAVEIFRNVLSQSPNDARMIDALLAPHISEPSVKKLHHQLAESTPDVAASDGLEIEHYGGQNEFTLDQHSGPKPAKPRPQRKQPPKPKPEKTASAGAEKSAPKERMMFEGVDIELADTETIRKPADDLKPNEPTFDDLDDLDRKSEEREKRRRFADDDSYWSTQSLEEAPPVDNIADSPVTEMGWDDLGKSTESVADEVADEVGSNDDSDARSWRDYAVDDEDKEYGAGDDEDEPLPADSAGGWDDEAVASETMDDDEDGESESDEDHDREEDIAVDVILLGEEADSDETDDEDEDEYDRYKEEEEADTVDDSDEEADAWDEEPEEEAVDFDTLYARYENGEFDNFETLELIAQACTLGRPEELKKLLTFEPDSVGQEIERKYYVAEFYVLVDQPLSALVILKTVHLNTLSREQRRNFLLKIAHCYQCLNRYEAAHSAYLRLMSEDPEFTDIEGMARSNYHKYLREAAGGAPVLEKITSL